MNIYLRELRAYRKSTIIWAVAFSAIVGFFMMLFPAFTNDVAATKELLSSFPEAVRKAINLSLENFFTIYGFYSYLLSFAMLAGAIQAMNVGTGMISKENAGKTADFLLSKPVGRSRVITAKLAAALTVVVITAVVWMSVSYLAASAASQAPVDAWLLLMLAAIMFFVQLFFLALGALFAVIIPKIKSVVAVSLPVVFAFYIAGVIGEVVDNASVRYITPFKYFDTNWIISNGTFQGRYLLVEAAVIVVAIVASYLIYLKKDVRASA